MKFIIKYIIFMFLFVIFLFIFAEFYLYYNGGKRLVKELNLNSLPSFSYKITQHPIMNNEYAKCIQGTNCSYKYRNPEGLNYKASPIVIFGCSFAHGNTILKYNQIFSYKLSKQLKRPVYNRAFMGAGPAEMYYQTLNDDFYKDVPPSDTVVYVMIADHYRRALTYMEDPDCLNMRITFKYNPTDKTLKYMNYRSNLLSNIFYRTYIARYFNAYVANKTIQSHKNAEFLTDMMLAYFVQSRKELEKHWNKKINFIVILYEDNNIDYKDLLADKLLQNGFKVIKTTDLIQEDLSISQYKMEDGHPTEEAWDLLTPLIIKEAGL